MKILVLLAILFETSHVSAKNYYVSSKGNDLQSGTSSAMPWRSLKKLSEVIPLLQPGDSIFFERGSVLAGELKITASGNFKKEIFIGAYGSGPKPIVRGSTAIKNWAPLHDNIWVADCINCSDEPGNLFIDNKCQPLGRYPNEGYMTLSCNGECKSSFTDKHHTFANGYWDGAEVVVKSSRWTLDNLPVLNYANHSFYCSVPASYPLPNGHGYFIQKHLATLDSPGEWFFDRASKKIFLYAKTSDSPLNHEVEVSVLDVGLEILNSTFVTIEDIAFRYQRKSGVAVKYSGNVTMRGCDVEYSGNNGMEISACESPTIENCRILNSNNNGVEWSDNRSGYFVRNFIHRTGLLPGRGKSGNGTYIGLSIAANVHQLGKNVFQFNSVDSTGYLGVDFRTGGTSIRNNFISNFCMTKDDGAGIYTWGNTYGNNKIAGNIVLHGVGNGSGTSDPDQSWVSGIYIDDRSADISIDSNTVAYCGTTGIYIHNAKRISILGNTLLGNGNQTNQENAQLCIKRDALVAVTDGESLDLHIAANQFATFYEGNHCVYLRAEKENDLRGLEFDRNLYFAPDPNLVIAKLFDHQEMCNAVEELSLSEWSLTGCDKNSRFALIETPTDPVSANLIRNSRMANNTEGWMSWPSEVIIELDRKIGANAPSLKVLFPPGKNEALLYYPGFSLSNSKWYRLSFSAKSTAKSKMEFVPLMASAPWGALDDYTCFTLGTDFKSFTYYFRPHTGNRNARLNFKSNISFWIDNVALSEVEFKNSAISEALQLFYNAEEKPKTISLTKEFKTIDGEQVADKLVLQGYRSRILLRNR